MRTGLVMTLALGLAFAACKDSTSGVGDGATGDGPRKDGVLIDGAKQDGAKQDGAKQDGAKQDGAKQDGAKQDGLPPVCTPSGAACGANGECCSGLCTSKVCVVGTCAPNGASCKLPTDCCNLNCTAGTCGAAACVSDGQSCTAGGPACCSTQCVSGTCKPLNPTCKTAGNTCAPSDPIKCCAGQCLNGKCAPPSQVSYCTQVGDICFKDNECCTGACAGATATVAGTCASIASSCIVDGLLCSGCTGCCSSFCAPFGTGPNICQPASGCHVTGDLCKKDSDCCGGDPTQIGVIPGAGLIRCDPDPKYPQIGTCSDPNPKNCPSGKSCGSACVPEGDVCHFKGNGGCPSNSIRNDCCDATGNKGECQLDKLGIPRCHGLTTCVPTGGACASSADCCNNLPCVPDAAGHLKCGATSCIPQGGVCTTTADCCTGLPCIVPPGSLQGICINPIPPPPPPPKDGGPVGDKGPTGDKGPIGDKGPAGDKGSPDKAVPSCALYGQSCSTTVSCCPNQGDCRTPYPAAALCPAGATNCTCYNPIL